MTILIILLIIGSLIPLFIIILDRFIIKLPESSKFKKWWELNIIGYENK
jgi:hypothetical protein